MIFDLKIINDLIKNEQFVQKYQKLIDNQQFLIIYTRSDIAFTIDFLKHYNNVTDTGLSRPLVSPDYSPCAGQIYISARSSIALRKSIFFTPIFYRAYVPL